MTTWVQVPVIEPDDKDHVIKVKLLYIDLATEPWLLDEPEMQPLLKRLKKALEMHPF